MKQKLLLLLCVVTISYQSIQAQSSNERIAENWIKQNTNALGLQEQHDFKMLFNRKGPSGETLRYYQMVNDVQVYDAEITIHINTLGNVTYTADTYKKDVALINTTPQISEDDALNIAINNLNIQGTITQKEQKLYVYPTQEGTKLAYSIKTLSKTLNGYWETIVDAHSGTIISTKDVAFYHKHKKDDKKKHKNEQKRIISSGNNTAAVMATGTAMIFNPDPLSATGNTYTGNYVDNSDATNTEFNNARTAVNLQGIEFSGGQYRLRGTYTEIASLQNPSTGLFIQASSDFSFTRDQAGFEAANVYYHLDENLRYINETLGITLVSLYNGGVVRFDPHAFNGADNSSYGGGNLNFGEGGVDDAEDADVILHELGHGLHDWVTNGSLSQVNGLSEGSGDYWAQSYSRSLNQWTTSDPSYHYMFSWDGHNEFWSGRLTNVSNLYPGGLVGQIHTDGQIWATVMMEIWDGIGQTKTDAAFLEGLGMTNSSTNQQDAAIAVRQAAVDMINAGRFGMTCSDVDFMTARFTARGYTMPALDCAVLGADEFTLAGNVSIYPNPTSNLLNFKNITKTYEVEVYNLLGQKVINQSIHENKNSLNVSDLSSGTYIVKFKDIDGALKFVKL